MFTKIALAMAVVSASVGAAPYEYEIIDLGTLGGWGSQADCINDYGLIVGVAGTPEGYDHAVSWQDGVITDLGTTAPTQPGHAMGVNNAGWIVGDVRCAPNTFCATLWRDGVPTYLDAFGDGSAHRVTDTGIIVGFSGDLNQALLYDDGAVVAIAPYPSNAFDINENGQVIGTFGYFVTHGFLYEGGNLLDLGPVVPNSINNHGQIVGYRWLDNQYRAVLRQPDGQVIDLSVLLGTPHSSATAINDSGWVVGWRGETLDSHLAFLHVDGVTFDLPTLGGRYSTATAINERGQIVGLSYLASNEPRAVLWNPIPEPPPPQITLTSAHIAECAPANVYVLLTNEEPVQAFSLGVAHDPSVATLTAIDFADCPVIQTLNGGQGPDFFSVDLAPGTGNCAPEVAAGGTVYCLVSQSAPSTMTIPAGTDQPIARLTYEAVPGNPVGTESPLTIVGCLGDDLPREVVLTVEGLSVSPEVVGGMLTVDAAACRFKRGDANGDGRLDISDAVTLLIYMFEGGRGPLRCEDAGDANDDGGLDIADAVRILGRLFAHGAPFDPPYPACGNDPTIDALRCGISACE